MPGAYLLSLGAVPYAEAWDLQRSLAAAVSQGAMPETVVLLEHSPVAKWITTHGYSLNVDLDTAPFTQWITACGLEDAQFTTIAGELGRPVAVDEVRPLAVAALAEVFDLDFEELPADDGAGLWPQPLHEKLTTAS